VVLMEFDVTASGNLNGSVFGLMVLTVLYLEDMGAELGPSSLGSNIKNLKC
jgi:hypothetical protein